MFRPLPTKSIKAFLLFVSIPSIPLYTHCLQFTTKDTCCYIGRKKHSIMPKALFIPGKLYIESLRSKVTDSEESAKRLRERLLNMQFQELPVLLSRATKVQETLRQRRGGNDEAMLMDEHQRLKGVIAQLVVERRRYEQRLALCMSALGALSLELAITEENSNIRDWVRDCGI